MVLLGDTVPEFKADSTIGPIDSFHKFCEVRFNAAGCQFPPQCCARSSA